MSEQDESFWAEQAERARDELAQRVLERKAYRQRISRKRVDGLSDQVLRRAMDPTLSTEDLDELQDRANDLARRHTEIDVRAARLDLRRITRHAADADVTRLTLEYLRTLPPAVGRIVLWGDAEEVE